MTAPAHVVFFVSENAVKSRNNSHKWQKRASLKGATFISRKSTSINTIPEPWLREWRQIEGWLDGIGLKNVD